MANRLAAEGVPRERIAVIHNWADGGLIRPIPPDYNPLRHEWGLSDRRVIGYSGNLGRAHDLPAIQRFLAAMSAVDPELVFLFIGGGSGREPLAAWARAHGLCNVIFRPYQLKERLAESLSVPDLHLVSLDPTCEGLIMPSKLYGILAAGRPVICLGDPEGAVAELVRRLGVGVVWETGRVREVRHMLEEARTESGVQAIRGIFEQEFDRPRRLRQWSALLLKDPLATTDTLERAA
jgi:glycosyltransferase involved in cell wall biosynthesis